MSKSLKRVIRALQEAGIGSQPVEIGQATTAQMAADLVGCCARRPDRQIDHFPR